MDWVRRGTRMMMPMAASQRRPTVQRKLFLKDLLTRDWSHGGGGDARTQLGSLGVWGRRSLAGVTFVLERETLHCGYGFGTVWTSAGDWNATGSEDAGVGGGCCEGTESGGSRW